MDFRPLATIAVLNLAAAMSPGPAFVLITRTAATSNRASAMGVAGGTVAASVTWAATALLGLQMILVEASSVYRAIQLVGGAYLALIGIAMWRDASRGRTMEMASENAPVHHAFWKGLSLGLSNPKVVVFFGTIFTAVLGPSTPPVLKWAALLVVFCNESAWYTTVALAFGSAPVRRTYRRIRGGLERTFGTLLMMFGATLVWEGVRGRS
ncbi:MAG TPA: LysE family transporter [Vicinamibacterales bacterium]|jgi:threonine/homoserine/homoserine lactone efflux protein